jgi:lysophospholipase L1-like esterase
MKRGLAIWVLLFAFSGMAAAASRLKPGDRIVTLGDSITEGVLVLNTGPREAGPATVGRGSATGGAAGRQSALLADAEPRTVGFGRLGLSINANGGVPPALHSFPWIYAGAPVDGPAPDIVVVNLGTNDGTRVSGEVFGSLYRAYLEAIRKAYPGAWILCLRPFNGAHAAVIESAVSGLGDAKIRYVDTAGWIDAEKHTTDKVHLNLEGNQAAAERLAPILKGLPANRG